MKLLDWLREYTFPVESKYSDTSFAKKVYSKVVQRLLENGTIFCSYFATIHVEGTKVLANECIKRGQRALIGKVCMDMNAP
jgi:guanine deaminase